jgi:hypothetical protein
MNNYELFHIFVIRFFIDLLILSKYKLFIFQRLRVYSNK